MTNDEDSQPVLLYDGVCRFCNYWVQYVLWHERRATMFFAPLQSDYARSVLTRHPDLRGVDSLVFVEPGGLERDERVFVKSDAALHVVASIGGLWRVALVAYVIPRVVRDFLYDQFAKRRYRWFGRYDTCLMPTPETRPRFLD